MDRDELKKLLAKAGASADEAPASKEGEKFNKLVVGLETVKLAGLDNELNGTLSKTLQFRDEMDMILANLPKEGMTEEKNLLKAHREGYQAVIERCCAMKLTILARNEPIMKSKLEATEKEVAEEERKFKSITLKKGKDEGKNAA